LSWEKTKDCDGNPVAGYNIYRSTSPSGMFTKLNGDIIAPAEYIDGTASTGGSAASAAASETTYYYVVTSVDMDGDESIQSAMVSPSPEETISGSSSGGGGGGCFISVAKKDGNWANFRMIAVLGISFVLTIWCTVQDALRKVKN
jgi:hypothetical protein